MIEQTERGIIKFSHKLNATQENFVAINVSDYSATGTVALALILCLDLVPPTGRLHQIGQWQ